MSLYRSRLSAWIVGSRRDKSRVDIGQVQPIKLGPQDRALESQRIKHGVLLFHLSNRYLDLPPLVARLGVDHDPPFTLKLDDDQPNDRDRIDGKLASTWAVLYRAPADIGDVDKDPHWQRVPVSPGAVWRDDFSNLLEAWRRDE